MICGNCRFWQGTKYDQWGDCYRVIAKLDPDLTCCYMSNKDGYIERFFDVPFDPHDFKYWNSNDLWVKLYTNLMDKIVAGEYPGVRAVCDRRDDIVYDQKNGERLGKLNCWYVQTHRHFDCKEEYGE